MKLHKKLIPLNQNVIDQWIAREGTAYDHRIGEDGYLYIRNKASGKMYISRGIWPNMPDVLDWEEINFFAPPFILPEVDFTLEEIERAEKLL